MSYPPGEYPPGPDGPYSGQPGGPYQPYGQPQPGRWQPQPGQPRGLLPGQPPPGGPRRQQGGRHKGLIITLSAFGALVLIGAIIQPARTSAGSQDGRHAYSLGHHVTGAVIRDRPSSPPRWPPTARPAPASRR